MQVYEISQGRGQWFEDFPYKMDGSYVESRINRAKSFIAYVIAGELYRKDKWVGEFPKDVDYITTFPIQKVTFTVISLPTFTIWKGNEHAIQKGLDRFYTKWTVEEIDKFVTINGHAIMHI